MAEKKNTWLGLSSYTYPFLSGVNPKQRPASPLTPVQLTDHPLFGLVVDSTNSLSTEETMDEVLRWMVPYCVCCHIKDYVIKRSNSGVGLAIVGAPAGQGRQRIPELLERLRCEARQDFSTILESWMECCPTMEEMLAQEDRWARESVAYLQVLPALRG